MHDAPMDPHKTAPFELGSGDKVCLLLHGFTGSPWDMRPLGEALAARGYAVRAIRLPGHGLTPRHLVGVTYRHWEEAALSAFDALADFRQIFVCGLSVGALLAVRLAAARATKLAGLALLAPALGFQGADARWLHRLRFLPLVERLNRWVEKDGTDISDPVTLAEAPLLSGFPLARLRDVWTLQRLALEAAAEVTCPTFLASAEQDHVVDPDGVQKLARRLKRASRVRCIQLGQGFHILPRDVGAPLLFRELGEFFDRVTKQDGEGSGSRTPDGRAPEEGPHQVPSPGRSR